MNKIYKVIWNIQLGCWQAVSELAKNHSGATKSITTSTIINKNGASTSRLGKTLSALLLFSLALLPLSIHAAIQNNALPTGGTVTAGTAQIVQNGNTLNIQQNSQNLSSNWNTFNIGQDATVNFNQPNQSSVAINHVLDSNASQIMGRLNANGQVFLLNPNGVVFSKTAQVNVGGIVASTLNLTDQDLQNAQYTLKSDANSNASVENHGKITTLQGGTVALIAPNVRNTGSINTPNGITHLSAASQVTLALQDGSLTQYQVDQGVLQGLVDNGGAIIANNGAVYLTAKAKGSLSKAVINHSGIIEANRLTQNARGEIVLLGDMQNGETHVSGILKAEGKNGQNGGLIETSAANVKIDDRTQVLTLSEGGKTGTWRIDPTDFTISAGNGASGSSGIGATTLQNNLSTNNVILETQAAGSGAGDIHVNAAVSWNAATELTLKAHNNININADISAADNNGKLHLIYGQNTANSNANYYLNNGAKVNLKAGDNFSTQKGTDAVKNYKVITALGVQGSSTSTDLQGINGNLTGNYVLGADIDASTTSGWNSGAGFNPLGNNITNFSGILDGLGHTISNLTINRPSTDYVGLFGQTNGASIRNIGLLGGSVTGGNQYVGGLVGLNDSNSTISNAYTTGSVTGLYSFRVGGLVGGNNGSISNVYATGAVTGAAQGGGLVGFNNGSISNAYATGAVTGGDEVGGLVGNNDTNSSISNAYATGAVIGTSDPSLGLSGIFTGGLVGRNLGSISNAYATGAVAGNQYVGGLVGQSFGGISNAYAMGNVTGQNYVGGLLGSNGSNNISNVYATGAVTGQNSVGGLVGQSFGGISNAYATGVVTGQNSVGGLVGVNNISNISNAYAMGNVTGQNSVGGLVGYNDSGSISNAYARGAVTGSSAVGGLVGVNNSSNISNAYAIGAVTGSSGVGGLVGFNNNSSISNVYATGAVTGNQFVGGLVGDSYYGSISNAYWNMETTGQLSGVGSGSSAGVGLTTAQMFDQANLTGLDFSNIWGNGDNQTTPYLKNLTNNQVFNKNDLPSGVISTTNRPALYTAILNAMQLQNINNNLSGRYVIGNHIDASDTVNWNSGAGFNPLGNLSTQFSGVFDGLGHTISNLTINRPSTDYVGLFGIISNASIRNIGLLGGSVTGQQSVGGMIGYTDYSSISNVYATGTVTGQDNVGGLIGVNNNGTISNVYATGAVTGQQNVGGLVGLNYLGGSISNAYATGSVTGQYSVGGLVGFNFSGSSSISNAYATGAVTGNNYVGGLVGWNDNSSISNTYAIGAVTGSQYVGGLVGVNNNGSISNAYWNMETTGQLSGVGLGSNAGMGLTTAQMFDQTNLTGLDFSNIWGNGDNQTTPYLKNLANNQVFNKNDLPSGVISTTNRPALYTAILNVIQLQNINNNLSGRYVLGNHIDASDTVNWNSGAGFNPLGNYPTSFSGKFDGLGHTISNLMINRPFTFESIGLFGITNGASIRNIGLLGGSVTGQYSVGGLVGYNDNNSTISNAYVTGTVIGSQNVGGLVGWNNNNSSISNAYATGVVTGSNTIGGLVGSNAGSIINTYTSAAVTGGDQAGGLVGMNWSGTISDSYATGSVTGNNSVGGLVGNNGSSISDSYATGSVTGSNSVGGLVGNNGSSIINTYATGAVTGFNFVGGLVGFNTDAVINNAYATGSVTGNNSVGGLAGHNQLSSIINAYATGAVTGNTNVGGLVGVNYNSSISNAYWNMETTGQTTSAGGTGLTTAQMFDQANFTGFDFSTIWGNGNNQTTPYLKNLTNNQVFNKNDLPSGVISATNRPALYTAILNAIQLQNINNNLSGRYVIGNNIDASDTVNWNSGAGFNPLGNLSTQFSGVFDGLGHTISNLTINRPTTYYVGLFGKTNSASIRNIGLLDGSVTGRKYVGGLVGHNSNNSSISTAYTTGSVRGEIVGGLVGENNNGSSISNAYAMGTVAGLYSSRVGGLVGSNSGSISNAYAMGTVAGSVQVGGLVGSNSGSISNAYATGDVSGDNGIGGLIGSLQDSSVSNVYATGAVTGSTGIGGLVGYNYNGSINNAYATGSVTGNSSVGGLVGENDSNSSISNTYAMGAVTGQNSVGGLVGASFGGISNAYWNMETTGQTTSAGGGIGLTTAQMFDQTNLTGLDFSNIWGNGDNQTTPYLKNLANNQVFNKNDLPGGVISTTNRPALYTAILNAMQLQNINNNLSGRYVIGNHIDASDTVNWNSGAGFNPLGNLSTYFIGKFDGLGHTISNLTINRPTTDYVGLFGYTNNANIRNIGLLGGAVTGWIGVGSLVGRSDSSSISNAYAMGAVTGYDGVGGLAGVNNNNSSISNAYATGAVTGWISVGGLVGVNNNNSSISNAYATGAVTGNSSVGGLVGQNADSIINNSYVTSTVTGQHHIGGVVGENYFNSTINNSYATGG